MNMPIPPIIPIPPHLLLPNPATLHAVRAAAGVATSRASAAGASSLLASALARNLWSQVPEWIREDESWLAFASRNAGSSNNDDGEDGFVDEMASLTAVIQKLEALVATGYDKLGSQRRMGRRRHTVRRTVSKHVRLNKIAAIDEQQKSEQSLKNSDVENSASQIQQNASSLSIGIEENEQISALEWHAALLAYWQLCNQIRERYPWWRDQMYHQHKSIPRGEDIVEEHNKLLQAELVDHKLDDGDAGRYEATLNADGNKYVNDDNAHNNSQHDGETNAINPGSVNNATSSDTVEGTDESISSESSPIMSLSEIKELQTMFDYAVWAYEPKEELLRSLLLSGDGGKVYDKDGVYDEKRYGYQLIVHRTTSYMDPNESLIPNSGNGSNGDDNAESKKNKNKQSSQKKNKRKPPGRVGYFVAISHTKHSLLIGMKGTSTLEELLTDCCGRAVRVGLENDPHHLADHATYDDSVSCDCGEVGADERDDPQHEDIHSERDESNVASILEDDSSQQCEKCNVDGDLLSATSSSSSTGQVDNDDLVDMIHVSASNCVCPSESVEVELVHKSNEQVATNNDSNKSPCNDTSISCASQQDVATSLKKTSFIRKVPSENVLLFPAMPRTKQSPATRSKSSPTSSQPREINHSPTDEFMESHGIEMEERSGKLRGAHEGILHCAQQLLFEIAPLIEEYAVSKGYKVVCTGHSLGAGTAILLAVLIRGRYPVLVEPTSHCPDMASSGSGDIMISGSIIGRQRVCAYAFAPPPALDRESSLACQHYVTSIVNNSDIIPRSSLTNLDVFLTILEAVRHKLVEMGMNPGSSSTKSNNGGSKPKPNIIASTLALYHKLCEGTSGDLLLDPKSLRNLWDEAVAEASLGENDRYWDEEFGHHLFVPGKLLLMYESWSKDESTYKANGIECASHSLPPIEKNDDSGGTENNPRSCENGSPNFHAMWTDGTASAMKGFDVGAGSGMATDHLTTSYKRSLALLEQSCS